MTSPAPIAPALPPADVIRARASAVVCAVVGDEVGSYRWIRRLIATTVKEYRGRFLHELIQNGFDAHEPGTTGGRIAVHFEDGEAEHGVLYVANGGRPLNESNFRSMASLGDSDKTIGVGIGNKGVGFKSVFQICDAPEVYSVVDVDDDGFSGFSFRFGRPGDLATFLPPDDPAWAKVEAELSLSLLTVPLGPAPEQVAAFRDQGYVTVLRMPVKSARAAAEIRERIDVLLSGAAPVMLFLDRLELLSVKSGSGADCLALTRADETMEVGRRVVLNGAEQYRVFEAPVPANKLKAALADAVEQGALDESWLEWDADATVSVAVGDGWEVQTPRAFTFLPMGENAASPLTGHINAPFVTDFARLGLDAEQPVNRLMFEHLAKVCVFAAGHLMGGESNPGAAVDLLAWNRESVSWVLDAITEFEPGGATMFVRLPAYAKEGWRPLSELVQWPDVETHVVTDLAVVRGAGASLIDESADLTRERLERLADAFTDGALHPAAEMMAHWVERVALWLIETRASKGVWRSFYDDLPMLFVDPDPLQGRVILLVSDGTLAPTDEPLVPDVSTKGRRTRLQRAVFFTPRVAGSDDDDALDSDVDVSPPKSLAARIVFLDADLTWYEGSQQTPGRKFLQDGRLVRQYRTASLLSVMGNVVGDPRATANQRSDALSYAFRLFSTNPARHAKELPGVGLSVPTRSGRWILASTARFSAGWPVPGADDLSLLAASAPNATSELADLPSVLLAAPTDLGADADADTARWARFLSVLGVNTALPVLSLEDPRRITGRALTKQTVTSGVAGMPETVASQWAQTLEATGNLLHPETHLSARSPVYWFTGQGEVCELPDPVRAAFARLVVHALPQLTDEHRRTIWERDARYGTPSEIPTPLWEFVTKQPWVPARATGRPLAFQPPHKSWNVGLEDGMAASYFPVIEPRLRSLMAEPEIDVACLRGAGFREWSRRGHADDLVDALTEAFADGEIPDTAGNHFRTSLAAAWAAVAAGETHFLPLLSERLLVEVGGTQHIITKADPDITQVFVTSTNDTSAKGRLIRDLGWAILPVDSDSTDDLSRLAGFLCENWAPNVQLADDWDLQVLIDNKPWDADASARRIVDDLPWLPVVLALSMRFPRHGIGIGKRIDHALNRINAVRLATGDRIDISWGDEAAPLPARLRGVLPISGPIPTLVSDRHDITWRHLETLSQGILELAEQERFTSDAILLVRDIGTSPDDVVTQPTDAELADALGITEQQVVEVALAVRGDLAGIIERLSLVAAARWGESGVAEFTRDNIGAWSHDDVVAALSRLTDAESAEAVLLAATAARTGDELRRQLEVSLADYNKGLAEHHPQQQLVSYGTQHVQQFNLRRRQRQQELSVWARAARIAAFDLGESQPGWATERTLPFLAADQSWATTIDDLADDVIDAHIDSLMTEHFGVARCDGVPEMADVEERNGRALQDRLQLARTVVALWSDKNSAEVPEGWAEPGFDALLWRRLDAMGALDFRPLDDSALALWLRRIDVWPENMPLTVDAFRHGFTDAELSPGEAAATDAKTAAARAKRQITLHGTTIDVDSGLGPLVAKVEAFLAGAPASLNTPYRASALSEVGSGAAARGSRGKKDGYGRSETSKAPSSGPLPRPSSDQATAIGLVGEMVAFRWLQQRDPSGAVDYTCWKSGNVRHLRPGANGDDGLGYDFEVPRADGSVMYEVKATSGDAGMIELGETEVRTAQKHARSDKWRLLIIEDALSESPVVHMLPNPFRHDAREHFRFVGNSIRLRFKLTEGWGGRGVLRRR